MSEEKATALSSEPTSLSMAGEIGEVAASYTAEEERQVLRKIDMYVLPLVSCILSKVPCQMA
jgi:hypothetical protein